MGSYGLIVNADWMAVVRAVPTVLYYGRGNYGLNVNTDCMAVVRAVPTVLYYGRGSYRLNVNTFLAACSSNHTNGTVLLW